jgi:hypothetical protein
MMKTLRYLLIFSIGVLIFLISSTGQATSQEDIKIIKAVEPQYGVEPGQIVEVSYTIPGGSTQLRRAADTMLVMDRSGSMGGAFFGQTKIEAAKEALKAFVDQTQEDAGLAQPGDYVGLATYSSSATLDFSIANMTDGNKTAIKNAIDSFPAIGMTSIGSGMNIANQELLNNARPAEIPKFMVLATDGRQNTAPSPYQNNILQTAIDNDIVIFTVGIGSDVTTLSGWWATCVDCPDPNGDGSFSGEEIMKDIACKTDQHRVDPADNCSLVWDETNDPAINDWDSPAHYFYADDPDKLTIVYKEIANEISLSAWYQLIEMVNTSVFAGVIGNSISIIDCKTGLDWDAQLLMRGRGGFFYILKNVGPDDEVCVSFDAVVAPWAEPGYHWVNQTGLAAIWDPEFECDKDGNGIINIIELVDCIMIGMFELPNIQITNIEIEVIDPAEPWLKTTGGDVGSATTEINMSRDDPPLPTDNADYLVIVGGATNRITNFTSARDWLIEEYSDPEGIAIRPEPVGGSMYDALYDKYTRQCGPFDVNASTPNPIAQEITNNDCNILQHNADDLTINDAAWKNVGYKGDPAVVFVSGDMSIGKDIEIDADTGLIFVVNGNIRIDASVDRIDGIYIADGYFNTYKDVACGGTGIISNALTINGAVYVFGEACFTRSLLPFSDTGNRDNPAEIINYEPKYLWIFRETLGDEKVRFNEVAP